MGDQNGEVVAGTLEMLILKTLALEPMHGYGVALRIEQVSDGVFRVNHPGALGGETADPGHRDGRDHEQEGPGEAADRDQLPDM